MAKQCVVEIPPAAEKEKSTKTSTRKGGEGGIKGRLWKPKFGWRQKVKVLKQRDDRHEGGYMR